MAEIDHDYESHHHDPTDSYSWSIPAIRTACCAGPRVEPVVTLQFPPCSHGFRRPGSPTFQLLIWQRDMNANGSTRGPAKQAHLMVGFGRGYESESGFRGFVSAGEARHRRREAARVDPSPPFTPFLRSSV